MAIVMGPGLTELAEWRELYGQKIHDCLAQKGYSEATLEGYIVAGFTILGGALVGYLLADDVEECDKQVTKEIGDPPYSEQNGHVQREGNGYDVDIKWEWVNRIWPIDNEIKWTYRIHCNSDQADEYISSFKIHLNDNATDLFDQTFIPASIKIICDGKEIDTSTWSKTVDGKDIHWKVGEGFENLSAAKKCCTIELEMIVEADGFSDLGTAYVTVNRGKSHNWGDGIPVPGPVLAAARTPEGSAFLVSQSTRNINVKPEFAHLSARELLMKPVNVFGGISNNQVAALEELGISSIEDLSKLRYSRLITAAKKIQKLASVECEHEKKASLETIGNILRHKDMADKK